MADKQITPQTSLLTRVVKALILLFVAGGLVLGVCWFGYYMLLRGIDGPASSSTSSSPPNHDSVPSEADARRFLANTVASQSNGLIVLNSFRKTDGQAAEMMGIKLYEMNFEGQILFNADCVWTGAGALGGTNFSAEPARPASTASFFSPGGPPSIPTGAKATKGQLVNLIGAMHFEKTENGWKGRIACNWTVVK